MVRRVGSRLRAVIRADSRIDAWIGEDTDAWNQRPKNLIAVRAGCRNRWILVTLIEQMNASGADVTDRNNGGVQNLPLNIEIPLHLIRRGRRVVVHCIALRWQRSYKGREWKRWENLNCEAIWRIEI